MWKGWTIVDWLSVCLVVSIWKSSGCKMELKVFWVREECLRKWSVNLFKERRIVCNQSECRGFVGVFVCGSSTGDESHNDEIPKCGSVLVLWGPRVIFFSMLDGGFHFDLCHALLLYFCISVHVTQPTVHIG